MMSSRRQTTAVGLRATELRAMAKAVHAGDLRGAESTLTAQAAALNSIFTELARRAACNMGEYMGAMEKYMRLALRALARTLRQQQELLDDIRG